MAPTSPEDAEAFTGWQAWTEPAIAASSSYDSASSIRNFLACPRKYFYNKTLGLHADSGIAAARGSAFHSALDHFHRPENEVRWRGDPELARRMYHDCCDAAIEEHLRGVEGKLDRRVERESLTRLFKNYFESEVEGKTPPRTVATEVGFAWHPLADVTIRGWIDRIIVLDDGGHEIIDYKTSKSGLTQPALEQELGLTGGVPHDFQLLIYFFGSRDGEVAGVPHVEPRVVGLWYPSEVMKRPPGIRKTQIIIGGESSSTRSSSTAPTGLDDDQVDEAHARIVASIKEIRSGAFAPTPRHDGYTCLAAWGRGCDYAWVCPGRVQEPEDYEAQ